MIFANAGGDHLTALPTIRALASLFPSRLTLISLPGMRPLFFRELHFRQVCEVRMTERGKTRSFDAAVVRRNIGVGRLMGLTGGIYLLTGVVVIYGTLRHFARDHRRAQEG